MCFALTPYLVVVVVDAVVVVVVVEVVVVVVVVLAVVVVVFVVDAVVVFGGITLQGQRYVPVAATTVHLYRAMFFRSDLRNFI